MKYIVAAIAIIFLVGCNESTSQSLSTDVEQGESSSAQNKRVDMQINKTYEVNKGDKLFKEGADAEVKISKNSKSDTSYVTLIEGKAYIIYSQKQ